MDSVETDEILDLTLPRLQRLLQARQSTAEETSHNRRCQPRWPFPAQVELWFSQKCGAQRHILATCANLSEGGMGMRCDESLPVGLRIELALHQSDATLQGTGVVRHCTSTGSDYLVGVEFELA